MKMNIKIIAETGSMLVYCKHKNDTITCPGEKRRQQCSSSLEQSVENVAADDFP